MSYISQVLKRNRTLKVLNLSENKIDMLGLVSIAEALVSLTYFSSRCTTVTDNCSVAAIQHKPRDA